MSLLNHRALTVKLAAALLFFFLSNVAVQAHDPGLSSAELEVRSKSATLLITYNERDVAGLIGETPEDLRASKASAQEKLAQTAQRAAVLRVNGQPLAPTTVGAKPEGENNVEFRYEFSLPSGATEVVFESLLIPELSFGHRQAFAARDAAGTENARRVFSSREHTANVSLDPSVVAARHSSGFREFFMLGIHHIITGYDHLLFLFGLLIVCRTARDGIVLITCFTVAHSLTLALSTFGLVDLPGLFVEATIAASILYVGIENLLRKDGVLGWRWVLTFAFGLIHGLGFAGVLHDMGIAKTGSAAVVPLLAFNLGVEAGQLAIAAVVLPILWKLRDSRAFMRFGVPACSILVAAAGAYWLIERTLLE
jgi:hydrogenase/urease accessory protein HupE